MSAHLFNLLTGDDQATGTRVAGAVIAIVTNNQDKEGLNRVAVRFPWLGQSVESWARVVAPTAGSDRGVYFFPELQDEVLVMFERGDIRFPFVIGALWNGNSKPPISDEEAKNNDMRVIKSRSGHVIKLNDKDGEETVEISDKAGNRIEIDTQSNTITLTAAQDIKLIATNGTIELKAKTLALTASDAATLAADGNMELSADGNLKLSGASIDIN